MNRVETIQGYLTDVQTDLARINAKNAISGGTIRLLERIMSKVEGVTALLPPARRVGIREAKLDLSRIMNHTSSVLDVLRGEQARPSMIRDLKVETLAKIEQLTQTLPVSLAEKQPESMSEHYEAAAATVDNILTKAGDVIRKNRHFASQLPKASDSSKPFVVMRLPVIPIFAYRVDVKVLQAIGMEVDEIPTNPYLSYAVLHGQLILALNKAMVKGRDATTLEEDVDGIAKWQNDLKNGVCYKSCRDFAEPLVQNRVDVETKKWKALLHDGRSTQGVDVIDQVARVRAISSLHYKLRGMKKLTADELRIMGSILRSAHTRTVNRGSGSEDYADKVIAILEKKTGKSLTMMGEVGAHIKARGWSLYWLVPDRDLNAFAKFGALQDWGLGF